MTFMDFADQKSIISPVVGDGAWVAVVIVFHRSSVGSCAEHFGESKIKCIDVIWITDLNTLTLTGVPVKSPREGG
jgi:hypothetical protein